MKKKELRNLINKRLSLVLEKRISIPKSADPENRYTYDIIQNKRQSVFYKTLESLGYSDPVFYPINVSSSHAGRNYIQFYTVQDGRGRYRLFGILEIDLGSDSGTDVYSAYSGAGFDKIIFMILPNRLSVIYGGGSPSAEQDISDALNTFSDNLRNGYDSWTEGGYEHYDFIDHINTWSKSSDDDATMEKQFIIETKALLDFMSKTLSLSEYPYEEIDRKSFESEKKLMSLGITKAFNALESYKLDNEIDTSDIDDADISKEPYSGENIRYVEETFPNEEIDSIEHISIKEEDISGIGINDDNIIKAAEMMMLSGNFEKAMFLFGLYTYLQFAIKDSEGNYQFDSEGNLIVDKQKANPIISLFKDIQGNVLGAKQDI